MPDFNTDPDRPVEEILKDIAHGAFQTKEHQANFLGAVLAPFAGLLVKLSRDAQANAQKLEWLTKRLYILTIVIAGLTLLLFLREVGKDFLEFHNQPSLNQQSQEQSKQNNQIKNATPGGQLKSEP